MQGNCTRWRQRLPERRLVQRGLIARYPRQPGGSEQVGDFRAWSTPFSRPLRRTTRTRYTTTWWWNGVGSTIFWTWSTRSRYCFTPWPRRSTTRRYTCYHPRRPTIPPRRRPSKPLHHIDRLLTLVRLVPFHHLHHTHRLVNLCPLRTLPACVLFRTFL